MANLRVATDSEKGRAPYQRLPLLAVVEMVRERQDADDWVGLTPDLVVRFHNLWSQVAECRKNRGDIRMPFHALGTDGVWGVLGQRWSAVAGHKATSTRAA